MTQEEAHAKDIFLTGSHIQETDLHIFMENHKRFRWVLSSVGSAYLLGHFSLKEGLKNQIYMLQSEYIHSKF